MTEQERRDLAMKDADTESLENLEAAEEILENMVAYPHIKVKLLNEDGNAFAIMGRVLREMRKAGVPQEDRARFQAEATSGDYDHLLLVVQQWVVVY